MLRVWFGGALVVAVGAARRGLGGRLGIAVADLTAARGSRASPSHPSAATSATILLRNSLVLALHASACVAGFIAGSSLRAAAARRTGLLTLRAREGAPDRDRAGSVAVTCFSLPPRPTCSARPARQLADQLGISTGRLVLTVLPHAIPELVALFLPLAAWMIASRRDEWQDLLAATFVTVAIAIPMLVAAATWEVYVWPHILAAVSPYA